MVCTGHCNDCAAHAGYLPAVTPTSWTDDPLVRGTIIKQQHWEELHNAIDAETIRRNMDWDVGDGDPGPVSASDFVSGGAPSGSGVLGWADLRNQLSYIENKIGYDWGPNPVNDTALTSVATISASSPQVLRDKTNALEGSCACDCNYACTCDCNYCVCDCNYCTCNCNYTCTCNCAYSDERLKREIEYL